MSEPNRLRFLIISFEFPPYIGGASTYAGQLAVGLSNIGHMVEVLTCFHGKNAENCSYDRHLPYRSGLSVVRFDPVWKWFYLQLRFVLFRRYRDDLTGNFDYVVLADARASRFAMVFFRGRERAISIRILHGNEMEKFFANPSFLSRVFGIRRKFAASLEQARLTLAVSEDLRAQVVSVFPHLANCVRVVFHGIDLALFRPISEEDGAMVRRNHKVAPGELLLVSASRLVEGKGHDRLIESLALLRQQNFGFKLIILGEGPNRTTLERQVTEMGLQEVIAFLGGCDRDTVARYMAAADVFVLVSRLRESFGLVYIEANACGTPVVAGRSGGVVEAVQDGHSGLLCDPRDVDDIARTIGRMADADLRCKLGENGLKRARDDFSLEQMARNTIDLLAIPE